jgi:hypothetical protein
MCGFRLDILVGGGDRESSCDCGVVTQWRLCLTKVNDDYADSGRWYVRWLIDVVSVVSMELSRWVR